MGALDALNPSLTFVWNYAYDEAAIVVRGRTVGLLRRFRRGWYLFVDGSYRRYSNEHDARAMAASLFS